MFLIKYPPKYPSPGDIRRLSDLARKYVSDYYYTVTAIYDPTNEEDDSMERSKTQNKWSVAFPGVAPERVQVKLKADRRTVEILVDGTVQKVINPPLNRPLKQEDLSVTVEHGLLTLIIANDVEEPEHQEDSYIPVNGKQFLQEGK